MQNIKANWVVALGERVCSEMPLPAGYTNMISSMDAEPSALRVALANCLCFKPTACEEGTLLSVRKELGYYTLKEAEDLGLEGPSPGDHSSNPFHIVVDRELAYSTVYKKLTAYFTKHPKHHLIFDVGQEGPFLDATRSILHFNSNYLPPTVRHFSITDTYGILNSLVLEIAGSTGPFQDGNGTILRVRGFHFPSTIKKLTITNPPENVRLLEFDFLSGAKNLVTLDLRGLHNVSIREGFLNGCISLSKFLFAPAGMQIDFLSQLPRLVKEVPFFTDSWFSA